MIPNAESTHPIPNATKGSIRREGKGRFAVRRIRASRSTSINWLNAAEPNAAAAVPMIRCSNLIHSIGCPFDASKYPKNAVISTKKFNRTFISTAKSDRKPGTASGTATSATGVVSIFSSLTSLPP